MIVGFIHIDTCSCSSFILTDVQFSIEWIHHYYFPILPLMVIWILSSVRLSCTVLLWIISYMIFDKFMNVLDEIAVSWSMHVCAALFDTRCFFPRINSHCCPRGSGLGLPGKAVGSLAFAGEKELLIAKCNELMASSHKFLLRFHVADFPRFYGCSH